MDNHGPVLLTGAFGNLGRRLVAELLSRGRTVIALDLRNELTLAALAELSKLPGAKENLTSAWVDLTDAEAVSELVSKAQPTEIAHLAAVIPPVAYRRPELARRVNVGGTTNLIEAAKALPVPPLFVECSSTGVYGARNPHTVPGRLAADTPLIPSDNYGAHKIECERIVHGSGLPHVVLRLGAIVMPELMLAVNRDSMAMERILPRDQRVHAVDVRDVALAVANAVERGRELDGRTLLIGGDESYVHTNRAMLDDLLVAIGVGRFGPYASRLGNPADDRAWFHTDWMDTAEAQQELQFQQHSWAQTLQYVRDGVGRRYYLNRLGLLFILLLRLVTTVVAKVRGPHNYTPVWHGVHKKFGPDALAEGDPGASFDPRAEAAAEATPGLG